MSKAQRHHSARSSRRRDPSAREIRIDVLAQLLIVGLIGRDRFATDHEYERALARADLLRGGAVRPLALVAVDGEPVAVNAEHRAWLDRELSATASASE